MLNAHISFLLKVDCFPPILQLAVCCFLKRNYYARDAILLPLRNYCLLPQYATYAVRHVVCSSSLRKIFIVQKNLCRNNGTRKSFLWHIPGYFAHTQKLSCLMVSFLDNLFSHLLIVICSALALVLIWSTIHIFFVFLFFFLEIVIKFFLRQIYMRR